MDERAATLLFILILAVGLVVTAFRMPRYVSRGPRHLIAPVLASVLAGLFIWLALASHSTAIGARQAFPF